MMRYFWKSLGPSWSSRVKRVTLTSGYLDLTSSEQKRSRTPATPLPLSWGATRRPSTSMVSPLSITHTDSKAICQASQRKKEDKKKNYYTDMVVFRTVYNSCSCGITSWLKNSFLSALLDILETGTLIGAWNMFRCLSGSEWQLATD